MALKIPDAPNIIGAETELRSPQEVNGSTLTPQFSVDFSGLQNSVGDVTEYYKEMVRDQTNTYNAAMRTEYTHHMTSYQNKVFQDYQGKDARDLYVRFIRPESEKWLADKFGAPKDDGELRIVDAKLQKDFSNWVETQQPSYIHSTANYEEREWSKYRETAFDAYDNTLATMILNANTPETIQNAINGYKQSTYARYPGMDEKYINQAAAAKINTSLEAALNNLAMTKPKEAFDRLNEYEPIIANLTNDSRQKVLENIRKSYKTIAKNEGALAELGMGGSWGMYENISVLQEIFGDEWEKARSEIYDGAMEKKAAIEKAQQGARDTTMRFEMSNVLNAKTEDEMDRALQGVATVNADAGTSLSQARTNFMALMTDRETLGENAPYTLQILDDQLKQIPTSEAITEARRQELLYKSLGASEEDIIKMQDYPETIKNIPMFKKAIKDANTVSTSAWRDEITDEHLKAVTDAWVERAATTPARAEAAIRVWKHNRVRQAEMPKYKELSARIATGEIRGYNPALMGNMTWEAQEALSYQIDVADKYFKTKQDLSSAGVDLDKVAKDTGVDTQYGNLDTASQNLLKRNLVYEVNNYKQTHGGRLPDADSLNGIMTRVQKDSVSSTMAAIQDVAVDNNLSTDNLTDAQRYELGVRESLSWDVNKPSKRGLQDQLGRAKDVIDKLGNSSRLTREERQFVKQNEAYLITMFQAGDIVGMANFIGLAKQGGF